MSNHSFNPFQLYRNLSTIMNPSSNYKGLNYLIMIDLHLYIYEYNINYELIENQYCLTDYNKLFIRSLPI